MACLLLAPVASAWGQRSGTRDSVTRVDSAAAREARRLLPVVSVVRERPRAAPPPVAFIDVAPGALQRTQAGSAYDLVRRTTGLEVHEQGQGPGFTANAVIRGFNSDHSADVLLMVDGVPINAAVHGHVEGFADWNLLLPAATQSLRVIHGSASPLYGDFALAGVVEAFTAADADGSRASLTSSSFGDLGGWWQTGQRRSTRGWAVTLDGARQAGWQSNANAMLGNALLRGWQAVAGGRLEGGVQLYQSQWDSPGFVSIARYNTRDLRRAVDSTDGGDARRLIAHARYARLLGRVAGRALSGEATAWFQQALIPMFGEHPVELGMSGREQELLARLQADTVYRRLFPAAFPNQPQPVSVEHITKALAAFQRSLISGDSPYDRYKFRNDRTAMSASALRGEALFFSEETECFHCHAGITFSASTKYVGKAFTEQEFFNNGLYNVGGTGAYPADNIGLKEFTGRDTDMGAHKAPTLRNIAVTAPYMHDGSIASLEEVLEHYARGGRLIREGPHAGDGARSQFKNGFVKGFTMTAQDKADLLAFLRSLTDSTLLTAPRFSDPWRRP